MPERWVATEGLPSDSVRLFTESTFIHRESNTMDYIGKADSQFVRFGATAPGVSAVTYHNVGGRWSINKNFSLQAGIRNLFDKQPPYYTDPIDQNTDPFTYDLLGRKYFVTATYMY